MNVKWLKIFANMNLGEKWPIPSNSVTPKFYVKPSTSNEPFKLWKLQSMKQITDKNQIRD